MFLSNLTFNKHNYLLAHAEAGGKWYDTEAGATAVCNSSIRSAIPVDCSRVKRI